MKQPTEAEKRMIDYYNQDTFRKQAEKRIQITKRRMDPRSHNSFAYMQKMAWEDALEKLVQMGIYNFDKKLIKGTQEEADEIFKIYYQAYLDRRKIPKDRTAIMTAGMINAMKEEAMEYDG